MNERQKETLGCGRSRWRRVLVWYLSTGAALAILRVAALVWLEYISMGAHRIDIYLAGGLRYPENVLVKSSLPIPQSEGLGFLLVWSPIIALVSFAMATPILLVGWLMLKRR
jgi:hypothetical protein